MQSDSPVIGFLGLGAMGSAMVRRLLDADFDVWVWNRSEERCDALADEGAEVADSPAEVASECDVIMICVSDTAAVESVLYGAEGLADALCEENVVIDFSSIDPVATRRFAADLEQRCGASWIDAPVSGGVPGAQAGTLAIMVGGDEDDIEYVRPLLDVLSDRVTRMGPVGAGQTAKLCNQMLVGCNMLAIAETIALAERAGIDAELLPAALHGGFADSTPLQLFGPRMAVREYEAGLAKLGLLQKDLDNALTQARASGAAIPMSALAAQLVRQRVARGEADDDWTTLIDLYAD